MSDKPPVRLFGDVYWDRERVGVIRISITLILSAVFLPVGAIFAGWYAVKGVTFDRDA